MELWDLVLAYSRLLKSTHLDASMTILYGDVPIEQWMETIRRALEGANWNVTQAAAGLGIDRTNLHRKMRKYGIARR